MNTNCRRRSPFLVALGLIALAAAVLPAGARAAPDSGPADGVWNNLPVAIPVPGPRFYHAMVADPVGDRLVVFGGGSPFYGDLWTIALGGTPIWSRLLPSGTGPGARQEMGFAYDSARNRLLCFGGNDGVLRNDVWALSLGASPAWTHLFPTGAPPAPRRSPAAIYDPVRDRLIVYAGYDGSTSLGDVWALSLSGTPVWTMLSPGGTAPEPRNTVPATYDPDGDRMLVFGGFDTFTQLFLNDLWALSLGGAPEWTQLSASGTAPSPRADYATIYDAPRHRIVISGGNDLTSLGQTYALSLQGAPAWTQLAPAGTVPTGRYGHRAVYDAPRDRMVMFGGYDGQLLNDLWSLSLATTPAWSRIVKPPPSPRRDFAVAYSGGSLFLFGGYSDVYPNARNDVYKLTLGTTVEWSDVAAGDGPSGRYGHRMIYDAPRDRFVTFGGYDGSYLGDTWALSAGAGAWTPLFPSGPGPSPRMYHAQVHDPLRERMIVIGGLPDFLNDVWALALGGAPAWTQILPTGTAPTPRYAHSLIYQPSRDRIILFAGYDGVYRNDVWELSLSGPPAWTRLTPAGIPPAARWAHVAIYDPIRDRMVIYGGYDGLGARTDAWALSLGSSPAWTALAPGGPIPGVRTNLDGVYDPPGDRMLIFGGFNPSTQAFLGDTWSLTWGTPTPALVSLVSATASPGFARITWQVADAGGAIVTAYRSDTPGAWRSLGELESDGVGRFTLVDRDLSPGARYGYRLGILESGRETLAGETWLDIPRTPRLALEGARPNPASRDLTIGFTLEGSSHATLALFDLGGRAIVVKDVSALGAGRHDLRIADGRALPAGLYFVRLTQRANTLMSKVLVVP